MPSKKPVSRAGARRILVAQQTRHDATTLDQPLPRLVEAVLTRPKEFARRIRVNVKLSGKPARLMRCLDKVEQELANRGIEMKVYFASLRKGAERVLAKASRLR